MWRVFRRRLSVARLLPLAGLLGFAAGGEAALEQIFLSPNQQVTQGSRVSIDLGGIRCSSDGGALPSLNLSAGAYPDQWAGALAVSGNTNTTSIGNQSSLLALLSLNVPLATSNRQFNCQTLLKDAQIKVRIDNLRQLLDEDVISESQFRSALLALYGPLTEAAQVPRPGAGSSVVVSDGPAQAIK